METLVATVLLTFLAFAGMDYWAIMTKHNQASHITNRYLARMVIEGRLSTTDELNMILDFQRIGTVVETVTGPRQSMGNARILRNPSDLSASVVSIRIVARPEPAPLLIGRLIGGNTPGGGYRIVTGAAGLSERVAP